MNFTNRKKKQAKGAKLATIRWKLEGKKCKVLERKNILAKMLIERTFSPL